MIAYCLMDDHPAIYAVNRNLQLSNGRVKGLHHKGIYSGIWIDPESWSFRKFYIYWLLSQLNIQNGLQIVILIKTNPIGQD